MEGNISDTGRDGGVFPNTPFFVAAAHEMKSPLVLLRQLALELESGQLTEAETRQVAQQMALTSERALRLTSNLTKHARLEDSLFALEPINPSSLCQEVVGELKPLYRAQGRVLQFRGRSRAVLGIANRDLLRRVLLGFIDNALHYSADDSPVNVTIEATEGGRYVRLGVRDYGPALPSGVWKKLEQTLGASPQAMSGRPESSGLGLYIAKQFADAMQAKIGAIRHRDGATFYIDIHTSSQLRLL